MRILRIMRILKVEESHFGEKCNQHQVDKNAFKKEVKRSIFVQKL